MDGLLITTLSIKSDEDFMVVDRLFDRLRLGNAFDMVKTGHLSILTP